MLHPNRHAHEVVGDAEFGLAGGGAPARKAELGITDNLVRVSIGVEHPDDLIADFRQALEGV